METDRIDGRKALNDFILNEDSLVFHKALKQAEKIKQKYFNEKDNKGKCLTSFKLICNRFRVSH